MELIELIWAISKSRLPSDAATEAADQFALVKRIVKALTSNPPKLSRGDQIFVDSKLVWGVSEVGRTLNKHSASYGVAALSLICSELIEPHPMRMAAAIPKKAAHSFSILMVVNRWKIPSETRMCSSCDGWLT